MVVFKMNYCIFKFMFGVNYNLYTIPVWPLYVSEICSNKNK